MRVLLLMSATHTESVGNKGGETLVDLRKGGLGLKPSPYHGGVHSCAPPSHSIAEEAVAMTSSLERQDGVHNMTTPLYQHECKLHHYV